MLLARRRHFGNIVGHVSGVSDTGSYLSGRPSNLIRVNLEGRGMDQDNVEWPAHYQRDHDLRGRATRAVLRR